QHDPWSGLLFELVQCEIFERAAIFTVEARVEQAALDILMEFAAQRAIKLLRTIDCVADTQYPFRASPPRADSRSRQRPICGVESALAGGQCGDIAEMSSVKGCAYRVRDDFSAQHPADFFEK